LKKEEEKNHKKEVKPKCYAKYLGHIINNLVKYIFCAFFII